MSLNKFTDQEYYSQFEGGDAPDGFDGLGGYQYVKLPAMIDNFLLTYTGDGKILNSVTKHEALFHAQRAVAELSYDVARPIKSFEYELVGSLVIPLPKDYVNLTGVFLVDDNGVKHWIRERTESGNPSSPLQDQNGNYLYTASGDILENNTSSETNERYQEYSKNQDNVRQLADYYGTRSIYTGDRNYSQQTGRLYGIQPEYTTQNGTYVIDDVKGVIIVDNTLADKIIVIDYITDGLDEDINDIQIHKFLEEAVYMYMLSKISKGMVAVSPNDKAMFDRDYINARRRGKLRLEKLNAKELIYTLRNRNKWIKY